MRIKSFIKIVLLLIFIVFGIIYFTHTDMPTYNGRLSLDLNNCTGQIIKDAFIEYEGSEKKIYLPEIKPYERVIVIAPNDIFDKPTRTSVYISYKGEKKVALGEYHSLNNDKYNADVAQYTRIKFYKNSVKVLRKGLFDIRSSLNIKPYSRVIDINKEKVISE